MVAAVEMAKQQQLEFRQPMMNVPRQVLSSFDDLVLVDEEKRTAAVMVILQHVDEVLRSEKQDKALPPGIKYIVKRLVSGLGSTRLCAREGFFSTLCCLLSLHRSAFQPDFILSLFTRSDSMKNATKEETRDQLVAELLLCGALVRAGQAVQSPELLQHVFKHLCAMRSTKSYMDITATQFLVHLIENCDDDSMYKMIWLNLQAELQAFIADLSPSQLWLRLVLLRKHHKDPPAWLASTITTKNHEALLQSVMKTVSVVPQVHPVYAEVVSSLAASSSSLLGKFLRIAVDAVQGNATSGKLQVLLHLVVLSVPHLKTAEDINATFAPSMVGLLLNSFTHPLPEIKKNAKNITAALTQLVRNNQDDDSGLQVAVVQALITPPGSVRFDQLAGHKVLQEIIPHLTLNTLKTITDSLLLLVKKPMGSRDKTTDRNYAARMLGSLLSQPKACVAEAADWRTQQLAAFLKVVLLTPEEETKEDGQEEVLAADMDTTKDAFLKALGKQLGHIREYKDVLARLMKVVSKEQRAVEKAGGDSSIFNKKVKQQWSLVYPRLKQLKVMEYKEGTDQEIAKTIFQVLYSQMAIHLFIDVTVATNTLKELIACHEEVKKLGMLRDCTEEDDDKEGGAEGRPSWMEVVTEMLLTFSTQEIHLYRLIVQGLFWLLTPFLTETSLTLLTDVLDTEKAQKLLMKEGEENDDDDDDDDESEVEESDESDENEEDEDKKKDGDKEGDSSDDSDSDDSDMEDEEEVDTPKLMKLKEQMLIAAGGLEVDVDFNTIPEEELQKLDEKLGGLMTEYYGGHPSKKKKKRSSEPRLKQDEQSLMHFQTRVCDMLIVFIKKSTNIGLQVGLVNPLFNALRLANQDTRRVDLQNKLANVITTLGKKKFTDVKGITVDTWKETVEDFFTLALRSPERFLPMVQSCYSFLMYCGRLLLQEQGEEALRKSDNFLTTSYIAHLKTYFTGNITFSSVYSLLEPCTYDIGGLWQIAATIINLAFDDPKLKVHKKSQALLILHHLYTNKSLWQDRENNTEVELDLFNRLVKALDALDSSSTKVYVASLLKLLRTILQVEKKTQPQPRFDWVTVHGKLQAFRGLISKTLMNAIRADYNTLTKTLDQLVNRGGKKEKKSDRKDKKRKRSGDYLIAVEDQGVEGSNKKESMSKKNQQTTDFSNGSKDTEKQVKDKNSEIIILSGQDTPEIVEESNKKKKKKNKLQKESISKKNISTSNVKESPNTSMDVTPEIEEIVLDTNNSPSETEIEKKTKKEKLTEKRKKKGVDDDDVQEIIVLKDDGKQNQEATSPSSLSPQPPKKKKKKSIQQHIASE